MTAASSPGSDDGMTLVELVIYAALLVLVLAVTSGILINASRVQSQVNAMGSTSGSAQLIARSVERGIRNASAFQADPTTATGQLLRARVVQGALGTDPVWVCEAWYYSVPAGAMFMTVGTAPISPPSVGPDGVPAGWTRLGSGVVPVASTVPVFNGSGQNLQLSFAVSGPAGTPPVTISSEAALSVKSGNGAPTTCFS